MDHSFGARLRTRARTLRAEVDALALAYRDPRTPWCAKVLVALVVAYAFSPLDLIPDFVPVLGYLDDLILVPLGIALALRMIPPDVMAAARRQATASQRGGKPRSWAGGVVVAIIWLLLLALSIALVSRVASLTG
ncbi:MAG: YkvA family protein [Anaerolineae bacterium]|nr:YkvA family protein [Anaerolineae bacterium]